MLEFLKCRKGKKGLLDKASIKRAFTIMFHLFQHPFLFICSHLLPTTQDQKKTSLPQGQTVKKQSSGKGTTWQYGLLLWLRIATAHPRCLRWSTLQDNVNKIQMWLSVAWRTKHTRYCLECFSISSSLSIPVCPPQFLSNLFPFPILLYGEYKERLVSHWESQRTCRPRTPPGAGAAGGATVAWCARQMKRFHFLFSKTNVKHSTVFGLNSPIEFFCKWHWEVA